MASGLLLDASPSKAESHGWDVQGQDRHYAEAAKTGAEGMRANCKPDHIILCSGCRWMSFYPANYDRGQ